MQRLTNAATSRTHAPVPRFTRICLLLPLALPDKEALSSSSTPTHTNTRTRTRTHAHEGWRRERHHLLTPLGLVLTLLFPSLRISLLPSVFPGLSRVCACACPPSPPPRLRLRACACLYVQPRKSLDLCVCVCLCVSRVSAALCCSPSPHSPSLSAYSLTRTLRHTRTHTRSRPQCAPPSPLSLVLSWSLFPAGVSSFFFFFCSLRLLDLLSLLQPCVVSGGAVLCVRVCVWVGVCCVRTPVRPHCSSSLSLFFLLPVPLHPTDS